jgi:hypothetical protein
MFKWISDVKIGGCRLDSSGSKYGPMTGSNEYDKKTSGFIKCNYCTN